MLDPKRCAVVLGAHGSLAASDSNQPLYDLADAIAQKNVFAAVTPAFLNGDPLMVNFMERLPADKVDSVVIVPVMTSVGYYLQSVIPKQIATNPQHADFDVFIAPVVGMHQRIAELVLERVDATMAADGLPIDDTTIVLVGHGTRRNANSCKSTYELLNLLKQRRPNLHFSIAFLDQDPEAANVAKEISTKHTVVIPFLISRGPHTTVDIPEAFGLDSGPAVRFPNRKQTGDQVSVCDLPVGMYPQIADLCVQLAMDEINYGFPVTLPQVEVAPAGLK